MTAPDRIAGMTLAEWREFARLDNCLEIMVPSELRLLIAAIPDPSATPADRIEALTEQLAAARRDAEEAEAYARELEAIGLANRVANRVAIMRLEARAERLEEAMIQMRDDRTAFRHAVHFRRFITTILKGTDHE